MSIFGSREDDPLLQDDPFAPSSEDDASDDGPATPDHSDAPPNGDGSPSGEPARPDRSAARSTTSDPSAGSVFEPTTEPSAPSQPEPSDAGDARVVVRSAKQAADGELDSLNTALDEGWRLRRIELRTASAPEGARSADTTRSLAFVLHRTPR